MICPFYSGFWRKKSIQRPFISLLSQWKSELRFRWVLSSRSLVLCCKRDWHAFLPLNLCNIQNSQIANNARLSQDFGGKKVQRSLIEKGNLSSDKKWVFFSSLSYFVDLTTRYELGDYVFHLTPLLLSLSLSPN